MTATDTATDIATDTAKAAAAAVAAQATLHHQWLLGLQLMVATREGPEATGEWMFRLFRRQHHAKFLSSFGKLGLEGLPHAVACARYHVLSNGVGGVRVEYMEEGPRKAWVRFRYPRWMYDGPTICGVPVEASRGFLRGWYAQNGVSLGNPRLGFVCVSEDMTGQFGLCGYFREADRDLAEDERLVFAPHERPPEFDPAVQPEPPAEDWPQARLDKAARNYAMEYCRNGVAELAGVLGRDRARELAGLSARLTGLQHYPRMAEAVGGVDGGPAEAAGFLAAMFGGMGDATALEVSGSRAVIRQSGLRIARGLDGAARDDLLAAWTELWRGAVASHRAFMSVEVAPEGDGLAWTVSRA
ncbi:MAG: hypothetical protein CML46_13285 [Rhodobacteraceae bacterium]|nr:hypothetical protein [Paracoccaceae bacterium]MBR27903.1 hypothetical protein [Paracoccaceae bacterium]